MLLLEEKQRIFNLLKQVAEADLSKGSEPTRSAPRAESSVLSSSTPSLTSASFKCCVPFQNTDGVSCYANSVLQSLLQHSMLRSAFLASRYKMYSSRERVQPPLTLQEVLRLLILLYGQRIYEYVIWSVIWSTGWEGGGATGAICPGPCLARGPATL